MTKEEQRAGILNMLRDHKINVNDALMMLDRLDEENTQAGEDITKPQKSYQAMIEDIVEQVLSDTDMERVYRIMLDMNWAYNGRPVSRESVLDCAKDNVRTTLQQLVCNYENTDERFAMTGTGGFQCRAWVDDGDQDNIQVELAFQPITGYGDGHLIELAEAKKREE